ncbi:MAG: alpha/beta hydrolase [Marmoricola sp.]
MSSHRLIPTRVPADPEGVVLVLHGGASRPDRPMVSPAQLSVLRMVPIAHRIARAGRGRLAVYRLLNSTRGWDTHHTPVDDVQWALRDLACTHGQLPTCLVGHSLGGRAALLAAGTPPIRSAVALNPWMHRSDRADVTGRRLLVAHGTADRIASIERARAAAEMLARTADSVGFLTVEGARHGMLRRGAVFERAAAAFAVATLLGEGVGDPVARLLSGRQQLTV